MGALRKAFLQKLLVHTILSHRRRQYGSRLLCLGLGRVWPKP